MNRCSDNISGSPSFTISTSKVGEVYEARCESLPQLTPQRDRDEISAIRAMRQVVERHVVSGGRV